MGMVQLWQTSSQ